jgi:metal-responsive CopG/Arc/MetJ family transcriptional regulator
MRTTIEIPDHLRAKLLRAAAERGEKGFSHIMEEALVNYFTETESLREKQRRAIALKGQLSKPDSEKLRAATQALRESWR